MFAALALDAYADDEEREAEEERADEAQGDLDDLATGPKLGLGRSEQADGALKREQQSSAVGASSVKAKPVQ